MPGRDGCRHFLGHQSHTRGSMAVVKKKFASFHANLYLCAVFK